MKLCLKPSLPTTFFKKWTSSEKAECQIMALNAKISIYLFISKNSYNFFPSPISPYRQSSAYVLHVTVCMLLCHVLFFYFFTEHHVVKVQTWSSGYHIIHCFSLLHFSMVYMDYILHILPLTTRYTAVNTMCVSPDRAFPKVEFPWVIAFAVGLRILRGLLILISNACFLRVMDVPLYSSKSNAWGLPFSYLSISM